MSQFEDMMDRISNNNEVPDRVWKKLDYVLDDLPEHEESAGINRRGHRITATAAAVVVAAGAALCCANPTFAAKIPFIGKIFAEVENEVPFSGNYSEKANVLSQGAEGDESGNAVGSEGIVKEDAGVKVTASEVYCDGLSVFLTTEVEVEQGGLKNMPGHYIGDGDATAEMMYLRGSWNLSDGTPIELMNDNLEGKVVDDHTFVGMLKLNLPENGMADGKVQLNLSSVGWDDVTKLDAEDISESYRMEGQWNFDIPFTVDTESVKEIAVNKEAGGYTLEKVFVSPYQVVTYVNVPFTEREITREEFDEMMDEKTGGEGDPGISYEEYVEMAGRDYQECETVICNQDGELLFSNPDGYGKTVAAVDGKEITMLHVFVFDNFEDDIEIEKSRLDDGIVDMKKASEKAVISTEIAVK